MSSTVENVDTDALAEVGKLFHTEDDGDTVNAALRDVLRRRRVTEFLDELDGADPRELDRLQAEAWR